MMRLFLASAFLLIILLPLQQVKAQADISTATHWYNRANYNPAAIVKTEYIYFFTNIRQQWIGVDGAPTVFNAQASQYIHKMHSAFGISLVGEKIGATQVYNPMATYAYRLSNDEDWSLGMGLSAGVFSRTVNRSLFQPETPNDPSIPYGKVLYSTPDANLGFEFQNKYLIFSLSSTHILSINKPDQIFLNTNHRYGSLIYKSSDPDLLNYHIGLQVVNRRDLTVWEGNISLRFKRPTLLQSGPREMFDVGLTYRSSNQMTVLFAINVKRDLRVGYAYDHSFIPGFSSTGTHELMLEIRIPSKASATNGQFATQEYWYH